MASWDGNAFRIISPLSGKHIGDQLIPLIQGENKMQSFDIFLDFSPTDSSTNIQISWDFRHHNAHVKSR